MCKISTKLNNFQGKRASEEKSGQTKKIKFYENRPTLLPMTKLRVKWSLGSWDFACSANQLIPLCVCQVSSKSNNFQGKRASEEKSGQSKEPKLYKMRDVFCFQS